MRFTSNKPDKPGIYFARKRGGILKFRLNVVFVDDHYWIQADSGTRSRVDALDPELEWAFVGEAN